ncbi:MAG: hypothetical protein MJ120_03340, partial [Clostridia bacterium]|nr:hypothetical protein [Clostridia bacterium]
MDENKNTVKTTLIKSITSVICCVALALTSSSIAGRVCDNKKEIADKFGAGTGTASSAVSTNGGTDFSNGEVLTDEPTADVGSDDVIADDTSADVGSDDVVADDSSSSTPASSSDNTSASSGSKDKPAAKEITLTSGLQSTNKAEVLKYYKLVAAKNAKGAYKTKMAMTSLDGGKGAVGSLISAFKPIAVSALEKNSTTSENIPGSPDKITEADWEKATAVNDGTYTTITVQVKSQTDGANGKSNEGTVGRSIGVLDGVQTALDNLPG